MVSDDGSMSGHDSATTNRSRPAQLQSVGRQPDARGLCASLHGQERAQMVELRASPIPRSARSRFSRSKPSAARSPSITASSTRRRDPCRRRADLSHRPADRVLRRDLRRRHRPAHARRRLRLYRIDDHLADLCLVHLSVLRDRSGHHVARARNVLRHSAVRRLCAQLAGRHSAGDARHHLHQPPPALDAADLDRAAPHSVRLHRVRRHQVVRALDGLCRDRRRAWRVVQPHPVRHRLDRRVLADRADRRAGRLPALSSATRPSAAACAGGPPICRPVPAGSFPAC